MERARDHAQGARRTPPEHPLTDARINELAPLIPESPNKRVFRDGYGNGDGSGYGYGYGSGSGSGNGYGSGNGSGYGDGNGDGSN